MESEKVKEIKECLQNCINGYCTTSCPYDKYNMGLECIEDLQKDTLTLINEFESENKELKKYKMDWLNSEKMHLQADMEDTEFELFCANKSLDEVRAENKKLKDRIAELEKENERLANVTPYQVVISDDKFEELKKNAIEDFNLTKIMLKQFAERLIEKRVATIIDGIGTCVVFVGDIDETLKEFIND